MKTILSSTNQHERGNKTMEENMNGNVVVADQNANGAVVETKTEEKTGLQKAMDHIQRGWDKFSGSKVGRWTKRIVRVGIFAAGVKYAYDKGKASVKPEVILATPVEPDTETPQEEPKTEETPVEEVKDE